MKEESVYTKEKLDKLDEIANKAAIEYSEDYLSEDIISFREKFIKEYIYGELDNGISEIETLPRNNYGDVG